MKILRCPVCYSELFKIGNSYRCENNHNFDLSKYGYLNLLLVNQHHHENPGDDKEMVIARKEFFKLDKYKCLKERLLEIIEKYHDSDSFYLCDIGCGEGYYTNYLHSELSKKYKVDTYGVDISKYALIEASKSSKLLGLDNINYLVANLSNLPFSNNGFFFLINCFAPIDEKEFYRILKDKGIYIRVLPSDIHLYGLKKILYQSPYLNVKKEENVYGMTLIEEITITDRIILEDSDSIINLFKMTPYYYKSEKSSIDKLKALNKLETDIGFIIRIYRKNNI